MKHHNCVKDNKTADNITYAKVTVQWLNQELYFYQKYF